ncbi:hypothetical protein [Pontibacter ruber]|uniref:Uncharacterized protein n=1 Tax=Pontibacter ruber TaxID=1343895 RepID=A0ABW5CRS7_9BACT|nr:hypothetical protein [Pontibacter ruber]
MQALQRVQASIADKGAAFNALQNVRVAQNAERCCRIAGRSGTESWKIV